MQRYSNRVQEQQRSAMLSIILAAVRSAGGTLFFKQPVQVTADDIGEEVQLSVRRLHVQNGTNIIDIGKGYSEIHLDNIQLNNIICNLS